MPKIKCLLPKGRVFAINKAIFFKPEENANKIVLTNSALFIHGTGPTKRSGFRLSILREGGVVYTKHEHFHRICTDLKKWPIGQN